MQATLEAGTPRRPVCFDGHFFPLCSSRPFVAPPAMPFRTFACLALSRRSASFCLCQPLCPALLHKTYDATLPETRRYLSTGASRGPGPPRNALIDRRCKNRAGRERRRLRSTAYPCRLAYTCPAALIHCQPVTVPSLPPAIASQTSCPRPHNIQTRFCASPGRCFVPHRLSSSFVLLPRATVFRIRPCSCAPYDLSLVVSRAMTFGDATAPLVSKHFNGCGGRRR